MKNVISKLLDFKFLPKFRYYSGRIFKIISLNKPYYHNKQSLEPFFNMYRGNNTAVSLDIGSGPNPKNPFLAQKVYGVDIRSNPEQNVYRLNLSNDKLPFDDNTFDFITAYDILEHIPRISNSYEEPNFPFINLMNEIFRVLKLNGIFFNIQPAFPFNEAFQDPTHVNIITEDTIYKYFCEPAWGRIYGFTGTFKMENEGWIKGHYFSFIKKITLNNTYDVYFEQK